MKSTITSLIIGGIVFLVISVGGFILYLIKSKKDKKTKELIEVMKAKIEENKKTKK